MYVINSVVLRISIVLGMVVAVVTILYFTPMPDQNFHSCDRPCHDLDWPMICRVKLTLESEPTNDSESCHSNQCKLVTRQRFLVNGKSPGPSIQICQNDILVVDVINKIAGHSVTIHWRGQPQNEAPTMDGVPMITQCPISSYTTFQYKFRASSPGTHLWHAYSGLEISGGIFGALVVRRPQKLETHKKLYDIDDKNHLLVISELGSLVINGKGTPEPPVFYVNRGKRYRFRVAYAGGVHGLPVTLAVEKHALKVVALDGSATNPYEVSSITLSLGERVDFILKTIQPITKYVITVTSTNGDITLESKAILKYNLVGDEEVIYKNKSSDIAERALTVSNRNFRTSFCESGLGRICLGDVRSFETDPQKIQEKAELKIYLRYEVQELFYQDHTNTEVKSRIYTVNNITFTYPSSPLLTQIEDVPTSKLCNSKKIPERCADKEVCECVHVEEVPLGSTVELVLFNAGSDLEELILHLHGNSFYVVGFTQFSSAFALDEVKNLDQTGMLLKRNFASPVQKDTIRLPQFGVVALRFVAKNPGYWILRDERSPQWSRGMDVVLKVGNYCDVVAKPTNFPTCGSWVGPDFFLT